MPWPSWEQLSTQRSASIAVTAVITTKSTIDATAEEKLLLHLTMTRINTADMITMKDMRTGHEDYTVDQDTISVSSLEPELSNRLIAMADRVA